MDTIAQMQAILDEHGQQMPDNVYLELSNLTRSLYSQVSELNTNQAARAERRVQDIAPWSVVGQTGRFHYTFAVPAIVRSTTDVDLRDVYDYGLGGIGHRYFWYRTSADGPYITLPMHLTSVDSELEADQSTWLSMFDAHTGADIIDGGVTMSYGEHNLSSDLRAIHDTRYPLSRTRRAGDILQF
eukprot:COSAG06_NODE_1629_length_8873_cov_6.041486_3_plen_185_part_00